MRLLILAGLIYLAYRAAKSWMRAQVQPPEDMTDHVSGEIDDVMVKDPLCEAYFPKRNGVPLNYDGQLLLFCSEDCREKFIAMQSKSKS